jgi:hypothetical protein
MQWGAGVGTVATLALTRIAQADPTEVIPQAVGFLIALTWTGCTGLGLIVQRCTETAVNVVAAALVLHDVVQNDLDTGEIQALRLVEGGP